MFFIMFFFNRKNSTVSAVHPGIEITDDLAEEGPKNFFKYNYLNDLVIHYRLQGAGHGFGSMGRDADQIIKDFIELN